MVLAAEPSCAWLGRAGTVAATRAPTRARTFTRFTESGLEEVQVVGLLVRRCVSGDAAAWEEIVQRYHRRIYNVCYRFAGDSENAQDLTQEVFIKMYRTLNTYDSGKGAFMTWVTTITRNLLVDHFRKSK